MRITKGLIAGIMALCSTAALGAPARHNVIFFVPDGLRAGIVSTQTAPTLAKVRDEGVNFANSHALFPTFTTANASAFATGHGLGDTGDFSNTVYSGFALQAAGGSATPFLESDPVLAEMDSHFSGNYLDEVSVLAAARQAGYQTAAIGKLGPVAIQDLTAITDGGTLIVDDTTGHDGGIALSSRWRQTLHDAGVPVVAPPRGANGNMGTATSPGTTVANVEQQNYFVDVAVKAVLPRFKAAAKPFMLVFWSRDPDGTQHSQGDSLDHFVPGINGPTSMAGIRNADDDLKALLTALKTLGLDKTTDVVVAADHGFSVISKQSSTSAAAQSSYTDVMPKELPPGFLAIDLAAGLNATDPKIGLFDPDAKNAAVDWRAGQHPSKGDGLIGHAPDSADIAIAANGGSDLIYLPTKNGGALAPKVVQILLAEDYVSGIFVDDRFGTIPGTLPLSAIGLRGAASTPTPAIVVNFASTTSGCAQVLLCAVNVADTTYHQGQGMHGSFSRADTWNFMAALGPDFKHGYVDKMPANNADIGMTLAHLLGLNIRPKGHLLGRVLRESFPGGRDRKSTTYRLKGPAAGNGLQTMVDEQLLGRSRYYDAAGFAGRTVGLRP